jgi:hypothetical protein
MAELPESGWAPDVCAIESAIRNADPDRFDLSVPDTMSRLRSLRG